MLLILSSVKIYSQDIIGEGTSGDPYVLFNIQDVDSIRYLGLDKYYLLSNKINADGFSWTPIGDLSTPFTGTLDGRMQRIVNLNMTQKNSDSDIGLFGNVSSTATIRRLVLSNCSITYSGRTDNVGFIAGVTSGSSDSIWVINSKINITSASTSLVIMGLVFGHAQNSAIIEYCGAYQDSLIWEGSVSNQPYIGGFAGLGVNIKFSFVSDVYLNLNRVGYMGTFGGFLGSDGGSSTDTTFANTTLVTPSGFCGGYGAFISSAGTNRQSYAATNSDSASVFGSWSYETDESFTGNYYDSTLTNGTAYRLSGSGGSAPTPLTTAQMKDTLNYSGWDFTNVWIVDENGLINDGYPYLRSAPIPAPDALPGYTYLFFHVEDYKPLNVYMYNDTLKIFWETNADYLNIYLMDSLIAGNVKGTEEYYPLIIKGSILDMVVDNLGYLKLVGYVGVGIELDSVITRRSLTTLDLYSGSQTDSSVYTISNDTAYIYNARAFLELGRRYSDLIFVLMKDLDFTDFGNIKDFEDGSLLPEMFYYQIKRIFSNNNKRKIIKGLRLTYDDAFYAKDDKKHPKIVSFLNGRRGKELGRIKDIIFLDCEMNINLQSYGTHQLYHDEWLFNDNVFLNGYRLIDVLIKESSINANIDTVKLPFDLSFTHDMLLFYSPGITGFEEDTVNVNINYWDLLEMSYYLDYDGIYKSYENGQRWHSDFSFLGSPIFSFGTYINDNCELNVDIGAKINFDSDITIPPERKNLYEITVCYTDKWYIPTHTVGHQRDNYFGGKINFNADTTSGWEWYKDGDDYDDKDVTIALNFPRSTQFAEIVDGKLHYGETARNILNIDLELNGINTDYYCPVYNTGHADDENWDKWVFFNTDFIDTTRFLSEIKSSIRYTQKGFYNDFVLDNLALNASSMSNKTNFINQSYSLSKEAAWNFVYGDYWRFNDFFNKPHIIGMNGVADSLYRFNDGYNKAVSDSISIILNKNYNPATGQSGVIKIDSVYYNTNKTEIIINYRTRYVDSVKIYWANKNDISGLDTSFHYIGYQKILKDTLYWDSSSYTWKLSNLYKVNTQNYIKIIEFVQYSDTSFSVQKLPKSRYKTESLFYKYSASFTCSWLKYGVLADAYNKVYSYRIIDPACGWNPSAKKREYITKTMFPYNAPGDTLALDIYESALLSDISEYYCNNTGIGYDLRWDSFWYLKGGTFDCTFPTNRDSAYTYDNVKYTIDNSDYADSSKSYLIATYLPTGETTKYYTSNFRFSEFGSSSTDIGIIYPNSISRDPVFFFSAIDWYAGYIPANDTFPIESKKLSLRNMFRGIYPNAIIEITPKY